MDAGGKPQVLKKITQYAFLKSIKLPATVVECPVGAYFVTNIQWRSQGDNRPFPLYILLWHIFGNGWPGLICHQREALWPTWGGYET